MDCEPKHQAETIEQQAKMLEQQAETIKKQQERIEKLEQRLAQYLRYYHGPKRERYLGGESGQELMFDLGEAATPEAEADEDADADTNDDDKPDSKKRKKGCCLS